MAVKYETVELPPLGGRKTGLKIRLTDKPLSADISDLTASGALTEELSPQLAHLLLTTSAHPDDVAKIDTLLEDDAMILIGVAAGLRLSMVKRQQEAMKSVFNAFKVGGDPKAP